jgi:hypothetical protein
MQTFKAAMGKCGAGKKNLEICYYFCTSRVLNNQNSSMADSDLETRLIVLHRARFVVADWLRHSEKASPLQVLCILRLLDEKYLLHKQVKSGIRRSNTPAGLRFLFYHHSAKILQWRERRLEGHPFGFLESVSHIQRRSVA